MEDQPSVPELLLSWDLSAEVIQRFIDADVSLKCLAIIDDDLVRKLTVKDGPFTLFRAGHRKWVQTLDESFHKRKVTDNLSNPTKKAKVSSALGVEPTPSSSSSSDLLVVSTSAADAAGTSSGQIKRNINQDEPSINELHTNLKATPQGKLVLGQFNKFGMLDSSSRDILGGVAIFSEIGSNLNARIPVSRFVELTKLITELFPTETADTWCEVTHRKKRTIVSGRLRHKFYNIRRDFIRVGLVHKVTLISELEDDEELDVGDDLEEDDRILWLKGNDHPWASVLKNWNESANIRKQLAIKYPPEDYVKLFPGLQKHHGYEMLLTDFARQFPEVGDKLTTDWPALIEHFQFLLKKKKDKGFLKCLECASSHAEAEVLVLCNIAAAFAPRTIPKPPKKARTKTPNWKPSSSEVQNAFILRIDEIAHLKDILNDRKETLLKFGHTLQPLVVLIGPASNIRQSLVVLNKQYWDCDQPLKAVDNCFKIFFALNTPFPVEARHIWLMIQRCVYNMNTKEDFSDDNGLKSYTASYINDFKVRCALSVKC